VPALNRIQGETAPSGMTPYPPSSTGELTAASAGALADAAPLPRVDVQVVEFAERVDALYQDRVDLGEHLCTGYDPYNYVTPCQVFITPQEHPNQDHEVCEPVPPGCPMP
jgi:hypothetical protein